MTQNRAFLCIKNALQCIVVNWWGVGAEKVQWESHALHRTIKKCGVANQFWPQRSSTVRFKSDTKQLTFPFWGNLPICKKNWTQLEPACLFLDAPNWKLNFYRIIIKTPIKHRQITLLQNDVVCWDFLERILYQNLFLTRKFSNQYIEY